MTDQEFLEELKKKISKSIGKKCKDFQYACFTCQVWMAYEIITDALFDYSKEDEVEEEKAKGEAEAEAVAKEKFEWEQRQAEELENEHRFDGYEPPEGEK